MRWTNGFLANGDAVNAIARRRQELLVYPDFLSSTLVWSVLSRSIFITVAFSAAFIHASSILSPILSSVATSIFVVFFNSIRPSISLSHWASFTVFLLFSVSLFFVSFNPSFSFCGCQDSPGHTLASWLFSVQLHCLGLHRGSEQP